MKSFVDNSFVKSHFIVLNYAHMYMCTYLTYLTSYYEINSFGFCKEPLEFSWNSFGFFPFHFSSLTRIIKEFSIISQSSFFLSQRFSLNYKLAFFLKSFCEPALGILYVVMITLVLSTNAIKPSSHKFDWDMPYFTLENRLGFCFG